MNPQPKLYHLIDIEGEKKLREVGNPYQMNADLCELELYHDWNRVATANAKTLINPVNGKSEYLETELRKVYRYFTEGEWRIFKRNHSHSDYFDDGYNTQEAFEYIGEKVEENEHLETDMKKASDMYSQGVFSLLNPNNPARYRITESATIDFEAGWESGEQAERSRIIGFIENRINHHGGQEAIKGQILDHPRRMNDNELFNEINRHRHTKQELKELLTLINNGKE